MRYNEVEINTTVPTAIFELPEIKKRVKDLFEKMEGDIKTRFDEIKNFVLNGNLQLPNYREITCEEVIKKFKINFYQQVSKEAVETAFTQEGKHDIEKNIIELISNSSLKKAILGKPMIYAFEEVMHETSNRDDISKCINSGMILLIEHEFLGENRNLKL